MKTIGLLGGMSWESTQIYYRLLNEGIREQLGGYHSAKCLLYSFDFAEIEARQHAGDWDGAGQMMIEAARRLETAGADFIVIGTNTMHRLYDQVQAGVKIPVVHIADPTAEALKSAGVRRVGLLGTMYTMTGDFYRGRLEQHGLEVITPEAADRERVHQVIYDELVQGVINAAARTDYVATIGRLANAGAEAVILGCTEICMLIDATNSPLPVFDTTTLHAQAAVRLALR